ncbi:hypothetical protein [Neorhizobium sp. AL 9.2.2]|uniref:hypothetical protein n=1 Tax=Neorhizobium sp. AL 9.2.2 TaxID=2712894 RepID=UPI001571B427|nr:hypothetical protein [Neorhizobium sp. AL 9.2.2]NSY17226.1 hypothetical protein [Neorhizobium sp. AL 9.2.2]
MLQTDYQIAVSKMSDDELEVPLTELLKSVGLEHFPHGGHARQVRKAGTGEVVGNFRCDEAIILYVNTRDAALAA